MARQGNLSVRKGNYIMPHFLKSPVALIASPVCIEVANKEYFTHGTLIFALLGWLGRKTEYVALHDVHVAFDSSNVN